MTHDNRPTAAQLAEATALREYLAGQVEQADRKANNALLSVVLVFLVACALAWALLSWADCTASGVAMCGMALQRSPRGAGRLQRLWLRLCIRWAEQDIQALHEAEAMAQAELMVIPDRVAERVAYLSSLRLRLQTALAAAAPQER